MAVGGMLVLQHSYTLQLHAVAASSIRKMNKGTAVEK